MDADSVIYVSAPLDTYDIRANIRQAGNPHILRYPRVITYIYGWHFFIKKLIIKKNEKFSPYKKKT
jgi:hypothetical protein